VFLAVVIAILVYNHNLIN